MLTGSKETFRDTSSKPSLKDNHYPGWAITRYPTHVLLREKGTGCAYTIPTVRFNKAAAALLKKGISDAMGNPRAICRCLRNCATSFSVDEIVQLRHWFFQHPTQTEAVIELAKRMALNVGGDSQMYQISGKQVIFFFF